MSRTITGEFLLPVVLSLGLVATQDGETQLLAKWVASEAPRKGDQRWSTAANDVSHQWEVYLRDGVAAARVRASRAVPEKEGDGRRQTPHPMPFEVRQGRLSDGLSGDVLFVEVADGWIVSFNSGEWGGWLWWFSPDGTTKYKIADDHVVGFSHTDVGLLAVTGIVHGTTSTGRLLVLNRDAGKPWRADKLVELRYAPVGFYKESSNSMILVLTNQLIRVRLAEKRVDVLLDNAFWAGLYPTSVVAVTPHTFYVGMRHGVAKVVLEPSGGVLTWLTPAE